MLEREIRNAWARGRLRSPNEAFGKPLISSDSIAALLEPRTPDPARVPELQRCEQTLDQLDRQLASLAERAIAAGQPLPVTRLAAAFDLSKRMVDALLLAAAPEVNGELLALYRYLLDDATRNGCDIDLIGRVLYSDGPDSYAALLAELGPGSPLLRHELLVAVGPEAKSDGSMLRRVVRPSARVLRLLWGQPGLPAELEARATLWRPGVAIGAERADGLARELRAWLGDALAARENAPRLLLDGPEGAGKTDRLRSAGGALGAAVLVASLRPAPHPLELQPLLRALVREARLEGAVLVLRDYDVPLAFDPDGTARTALCDALQRAPVPIALTTCVREASFPPIDRPVARLSVSLPDPVLRTAQWAQAFAGSNTRVAADLDLAGARYAVAGGVLRKAVRAATSIAGGHAVTLDHIGAGVRSYLDQRIGEVGARVSPLPSLSELILPEDTLRAVLELLARVRHRRTVLETWGYGRKLGKGLGLNALFAGPPGTGKSMAACAIAAELGMDAYRIDLSQVVSKWVGETEKNLSRVFDAAEAGTAMLLFDEADALFARRTEVKSSVDRYANLEVNYLLQRLEAFQGIAILTTNLESSVDAAFKRRLSLQVRFPFPDEATRARLWQSMFPRDAPLAKDLDLAALAKSYEMTGGNIRNAALRAAYLAAAAGEAISNTQLLRAIELEYREAGKLRAGGKLE